MKTLSFAALSILLTFVEFSHPLEAREPVQKAPLFLAVGEQRALWTPSLLKYSLGCTEEVRATQLPPSLQKEPHLLLKGVRPGHCDLWIWKTNGESEIRPLRIERTFEKNASNSLYLMDLPDFKEIEVIASPSRALLRGMVHTQAEAERVYSAQTIFPEQIQNQTRLDSSLLQRWLKEAQEWISKNGLRTHLDLEPVGDSLIVRGGISDPKQHQELKRDFFSRFPLGIWDVHALGSASHLLFFRVYLLETRRSALRSLGLDPPSQLDFKGQGEFKAVLGSNPLASLSQTLDFDWRLRALEQDGNARVLSQPQISIRIPGESTLFSGGELPIRTSTRFQNQLQWKKFGLALQVKALEFSSPYVRLDLTSSMSDLDHSLATTDGIPGVRTNEIKTQVDARVGHPLFLSGLIDEKFRERVSGLPFLRDIPILGSLFGSEDFQNSESEFLVILIPHTTPPPPPSGVFPSDFPQGPVPPPRDWLSSEDIRLLQSSSDYPWNVFQ